MATGDTWLDARALLAACGGEAAILEALKEAVRSCLPKSLARAEEALARGDAEALREAAHGFHGMVATVSTLAGTAASAIEDAAIAGDLPEAGTALEELKGLTDAILLGIGGVTLEQLGALAGSSGKPSRAER